MYFSNWSFYLDVIQTGRWFLFPKNIFLIKFLCLSANELFFLQTLLKKIKRTDLNNMANPMNYSKMLKWSNKHRSSCCCTCKAGQNWGPESCADRTAVDLKTQAQQGNSVAQLPFFTAIFCASRRFIFTLCIFYIPSGKHVFVGTDKGAWCFPFFHCCLVVWQHILPLPVK